MLKPLFRFFTVALLLDCAAIVALAQAPAKDASCDQEKALLLIVEQLEANNMLSPGAKRVGLYCQGADLLWKHRQDQARAAFQAAYDWAEESEAEKEKTPKTGGGGVSVARGDLRLDVIRAIAKHDAKWSKLLMDKLLAEKAERAEKSGPLRNEETAYQAEKLLAADQASAINLARFSLASASGAEIASFIVTLAKQDSRAADAFYLEALAALSKRSVNETLSLSVYPFAAERPIGASWRAIGVYAAKDLQPNPALQLRFIELLLQLAAYHAEQPIVTNAPPDGGAYRLSPAARLFVGLHDLEPIVAARFPPLHAKLLQAKQRLTNVITEEYMKTAQSVIQAKQAAPFNRNLSDAERAKYPGGQDRFYHDAIREGLNTEPPDQLEKLLEKIFDSTTRKQMGEWLYYNLAQRALTEGRPDEAVKLMEKVDPLDLRAYLAFQIAEAALNKSKDNRRAAESLAVRMRG
jgi:hypothetical protein